MTEKDLEGMVEYLKIEVPKYLEDEVKEVKFAIDFEYTFGEGGVVASGKVYEVLLNSGKKVFAVDGGFEGRSTQNVYGQELPDAKMASKVHLYTLMAMKIPRGNMKMKRELEKVAGGMGLPKKYRKTY